MPRTTHDTLSCTTYNSFRPSWWFSSLKPYRGSANSSSKWVSCILTAQGSKVHHVDVKHHLQQASNFANRWILKDHQVSITTRLKYFDEVVTTVACFAAGHRPLYRNDLVNIEVSYKKLCRQIVRPPTGNCISLK